MCAGITTELLRGHGKHWHWCCVSTVCRKPPGPELTPEEKDARTVFCMQLAARIRAKDLTEFFSAVGKVHY